MADGTLPLDLDHVGCIVEALPAGAQKWGRLGFALTPVSRQRGSVPGREGFHPWATANHCAILGNTYLELIGTVDRGAFNPWGHFITRGEGLYIFALRCADADAAHAALCSRTDAFSPPVARERVLDVGGVPRTMRFRNIFSRDAAWPETRYLVIEHQTPDYLWQPKYQQHENGARDLVGVTLVAGNAASLVSRMDALGAGLRLGAGGFTAKLPGRGSVHVMGRDAYANDYGYVPRDGMQAITVSFDDLAHALATVKRAGVRVYDSPQGSYIGPQDANGCVMHLVQHADDA